MEQAIATILACVISAVASCMVAIINSNARQAKSEQKSLDAQEAINKELASVNSRLIELKNTDSCCVTLQEDVQEIKENVGIMSTTLNQFKASSDEFDEKLQDAFKAIAKDRISQGHRYFMSKGYITESSKESMHAIYESYKKMGGNGYVETEMNDMNKLLVKD